MFKRLSYSLVSAGMCLSLINVEKSISDEPDVTYDKVIFNT